MDYRPGKPEDFFTLARLYSPFCAVPPAGENGPGKWRLQVETFVREDRTLLLRERAHARPIPPPPTSSPTLPPPLYVIHLGPFNTGNGRTGIQIPKRPLGPLPFAHAG